MAVHPLANSLSPKEARRPDGRLNFQLNKPLLCPLRNKTLRLLMLKCQG